MSCVCLFVCSWDQNTESVFTAVLWKLMVYRKNTFLHTCTRLTFEFVHFGNVKSNIWIGWKVLDKYLLLKILHLEPWNKTFKMD